MRWIRRSKGTMDKSGNRDQDARRALIRAEDAHRKAVEQTGEISALSNRLRALRETNHFADLLRAALHDGGDHA